MSTNYTRRCRLLKKIRRKLKDFANIPCTDKGITYVYSETFTAYGKQIKINTDGHYSTVCLNIGVDTELKNSVNLMMRKAWWGRI